MKELKGLIVQGSKCEVTKITSLCKNGRKTRENYDHTIAVQLMFAHSITKFFFLFLWHCLIYNKNSIQMDDLRFYILFNKFQLYQDDRQMIMKGCVQ